SHDVDPASVIQAERRGAVELLQQYTRLKRDALDEDLGWSFLVDSLIFKAEARVRWLDACEERLSKAATSHAGTVPGPEDADEGLPSATPEEVLR
ncbi:MAG TPA: PadR family transcriptional regulator, partial [Actinomycetota bacterium]|nr:PadR family transcriptional regulator [Actinomycetota bacterium]